MVIIMFKLFKKKKIVTFAEVLEQMKDKIVTDSFHCHFYCDRYWKVYEWELEREFYIGDELKVHEFYVVDNIHYRNSFTHIVE